MKVLILGSTGFLGSYFGFAVPRLGHTVAGISRRYVSYFPSNTVVNSLEDISTIIRSGGYEVVVNCVAIASHELCEANPENAELVNGTFPGIWAEDASQSGAHFVQISTDAVFDGNSRQLYAEEDDINPISKYGESKLLGESSALASDSSALVVRTNFFGWSNKGRTGILDFFVKAQSARKPVTGFQDYSVSSIYMGHLVEAIFELLERNTSGLIHVASSTVLSKYEFGVMVSEHLGYDSRKVKPGFITDQNGMVKRGRDLGLASERAQQILKHDLPSTADGLRQAMAERQDVISYFAQIAK